MGRKRNHALTAAIVGAAVILAALTHPLASAPPNAAAGSAKAVENFRCGAGWQRNGGPVLNEFRAWTEKYQRAGIHQRRALVVEGVGLAKERRHKMRELMRRDPRAALGHAVPHAVRKSMPPEVVTQFEERIAARGHLAAVAGKSVEEDHPCSFDRRVFLEDGRSFEALVYGRRLSQTTEYDAWLHGIALDGMMVVHESPVRLLDDDEVPGKPVVALCPGETAGVLAEVAGRIYKVCTLDDMGVLASGFIAAEDQPGPRVQYPEPTVENLAAAPAAGLDPAWTLGEKDVLYLRVDFPDRPGAPVGHAEASNMLRGDVDRFYRDASYERTRLACTIPQTVYRMPHPAAFYATNDSYYQLFLDVSHLAAADGYNVDNYDRVLTAFTGLADIPGSRFTRAAWAFISGKEAWFNGYFTPGLTAHEMGHNYGVHHANFWRTFEGSIVGSGATEEYGDPLDIMGTATDGRGHFNPWFKHMLRWLDDADVQTVTANGIYRVHRFDHPASTGVRALKVVRGDGRNYWIGLRQLFTGNPGIFNGAYIIWGYNRDSIQSDLLDMSPGLSGQSEVGLPIDSLFEDAEAGIAIRPVAKGGADLNEYLDVEISFFVVGLSDAVDAPLLNVRAGGTVPWRRQSIITRDGADAAESGTIGDNQESWIETTVTGPGTLSFWWRVSSEAFDPLQFFTNGALITQISGEVPWQQRSYQLSAGSHTLRWRYVKNASQSGGEDKAWLDQVSFTPAPCFLLGLEAESASLVAPMTVGTEAVVSGGEYIVSASADAGTAAWSIDLPSPSSYVLWARVLAKDTNSDSFFVSANGGPEQVYTVTPNPGTNWQWTRVNGTTNPRIFNLFAGQTTIVFRGREAGARLDQLILTCDLNFVPSDPPVIAQLPQSVDVTVGDSTTLRVTARGFQPMSYRWLFAGEDLVDSADISGTRTPVLNLQNLQLDQSGLFTVIVSNRFGTAIVDTVVAVRPFVATFGVFADRSFVASTNVEASLQGLGFSAAGFTNVAGAVTVHRQIVIPSLLRDLGSELSSSEKVAVSNFVHGGGKLIVHGSFEHYGAAFLNNIFGMNLLASRQSDEATPFSRMPGASGSEFQDDPTKVPINNGTTALFAHRFASNARSLYERNGQAAGVLWEWGNGAIIFLGWDWQNAAPIGTADGGWLALLQSAAAQSVPLPAVAPVLVRQPLDQPVAPGESVTFTARAEGSVPLFYRWRKDGLPINGATNASCTIAAAQHADAGVYTVVVTNRAGTAISSNALLAIALSARFTNASSLVIPDGVASQYPSTISVSGLVGTVLGVQVTLSNLSHSYPDDVDVLLVGPRGQRSLLMSDAGGSAPVSSRSLIFSEHADQWIGDDGPLASGTYRPTEYESNDIFPPPAPRGPYAAGLEVFKETDPNGAWSLFVMDDAAGDNGVIAGGWSLRIWTHNDLVINTTLSATDIVLNWPATTNRVYRILYRDTLSQGESWQPLPVPISVTNGIATTADPMRSQRFYRVEVFQD